MMLPTNTDLLSLMNAPLHSRSEGFIRNWLDCQGDPYFDNRLCILIRHLLTMSSSDHSILRLGWSDFTFLESCKDRAKNPICSYLVDFLLESIQVYDTTLKFRASHTLDFGDMTHNIAWIDVGAESSDLSVDKLKPHPSSQFNSPASTSTTSSFSNHSEPAISIDMQTDHGLRIILSDALKLKRGLSDSTEKGKLSLLSKLRDFVTDWSEKIKSAPVRPLLALSEATGPRANCLLFKLLCDACNLPCRLRRIKETRRRWIYYTQVVISSSSGERLVQVDWGTAETPEIERLQMQTDPVDLEKAFEFVQVIGRGSFAEVWQVRLKSSNRRSSRNKSVSPEYALKLVNSRLADLEEAELARACSRHPRVASFISVFQGFQLLENRKKDKEKQQSLCLVMEIQDTCLEKRLQRKIDWEEYLPILIDVSSAMSFMHRGDAHILHRDLKPGNILIDSRGRASVADFGVARMNPSYETNLTVEAGTADYMAPEQRTVEYDRPADVFSFGIVVARILGVDGWAGLSTGGEVHAPRDADPQVLELCQRCLDINPLLRPSFSAIQDTLISLLVTRLTGLGKRQRRV